MKEKWDSRGAFVLAAVGSAVGLGNIWRFPIICYKYGGGAFLVAYIIALFLVGIPILILEFSLGAKMSASAPLSFKKINKRFTWIGWFALLIAFIIVTYYTVIMSWSANYLIHSVTLKWGSNPKTFFFGNVLHLTQSIEQTGRFVMPLIIGLVVIWIWIILSIWKGAKTVSKVVYVTVILPWIILIVLVIRGITLPGAIEGIKYYLTPNWSQLANLKLWQEAFTQIFFSLSVGFGVMIAYASFLPKKSDVVNNAFIIGLADAATAYVGGFAVFSVLGFYAEKMHVPISEVMKSGPQLAFITYPAIINNLPLPQLFGILFFLMLLTLAVDSAFSLVEAGVAGLQDTFNIKRGSANLLIAVVAILIGLIYTTGSGLYWLDIVDHFMSYYGLFFSALLETLVIAYFYRKKLKEYANSVSEIKIGFWWDIIVMFIIPIISIFLLVNSIIDTAHAAYGGYPRWAEIIAGWLPLILALIFAFVLSHFTNRREK